jgi:hypothetical protein
MREVLSCVGVCVGERWNGALTLASLILLARKGAPPLSGWFAIIILLCASLTFAFVSAVSLCLRGISKHGILPRNLRCSPQTENLCCLLLVHLGLKAPLDPLATRCRRSSRPQELSSDAPLYIKEQCKVISDPFFPTLNSPLDATHAPIRPAPTRMMGVAIACDPDARRRSCCVGLIDLGVEVRMASALVASMVKIYIYIYMCVSVCKAVKGSSPV